MNNLIFNKSPLQINFNNQKPKQQDFSLFTKAFNITSSSTFNLDNYYSLFHKQVNNQFSISLPTNNKIDKNTKVVEESKKSPVNTIKMNLNLESLQISKTEEPKEKMNKVEFSKVCSEVLPNFLYLSGQDVSSNLETLKENKITHIINAAAEICDSCFSNDFKYLNLYLRDQANENIECCFYTSFDFIEEAKKQGGRVLVHCVQGISRSTTIILSYLILSQRITYEEALKYTESKREIVNPNVGFSIQAQDFYTRITQNYESSKIKPKIYALGLLNQSYDVIVVRYVSL